MLIFAKYALTKLGIMEQNEKEKEILRLVQGMDVSEIIQLLMKSGNRYNRRILKFFRWFCKWMPIAIMLVHSYGMINFSTHPREMLIKLPGNEPCYLFIYFMVYLFPMVIILASRFFWLCWRYRIPFFYYFGVNAIHIVHHSIFTTNAMIMSHYALMVMTAIIYVYSFADLFCNRTRLGRKIFS